MLCSILYYIIHIYITETLEKAQKMLKKYVDCDIHTSEITSDEEGHERIKRKKRLT